MVFNTNLANWFAGGTKGREHADMRARWDEVQSLWRASPIGRLDAEYPVSMLAIEIDREAWRRVGRIPKTDLAVALGDATADLLWDEAIGDVKPPWDAIEADVSVAVEFREAMARRRRYVVEFERLHRTFTRHIVDLYEKLYASLPDSCFGYGEGPEGSFEVPLLELVEDPVGLITELATFAYHPDIRSLDLLKAYRAQTRVNLLLASGLDPTLTEIDRPDRVVLPAAQKHKTPAQLADLYLAHTPFRAVLDLPVPFHLSEEVRFEHCHIVGGTGHGKTQLLQRLIHADLVKAQTEKRSVVVIDSQGDLINRLVRLSLFSPETANSLAERLVVIDPADVEFPPALNLFDAHLDRLEDYRPVDRERVLNGVVEVYEDFFGELLGAELTQKQGVVFKYLARLMLAIPNATIHTLIQLMENPKPFIPYMETLEGSARFFFETEFFDPAFSQTKRQIQRRLWGVLATPAFERMFAQARNKVDLFEALQDGKIILINTAKDLLKQEGSKLFGRFFIGLLAQATLERSTLDPEDRTPSMVYVDEAQEYFDDTVETILNQARKYRVGITMAHQALDQLTPRLRDVMAANTSMKCAGGVSAKDARAMASELHTETEFVESMRRRQGKSEFAVWIRNQTPHAIRLAVPLGFLERQPILAEEEFEALLEQNRRRYCGTQGEVEAELRKLRPAKPFGAGADRSGRMASSVPGDAPTRPTRATEPRAPAVPVEPPPSPAAPEAPARSAGSADPSDRTPPPSAPEPGKGGSQHRYLQQLVKGLATDRGFRAVIEEQVDGGQVDVALYRDGTSIACEISVTSTPDYEAQNLAKCLRAGFSRVWAVAPDAKRKKAIRDKAKARLGEVEAAKVDFVTTDELVFLLEQLAEPEAEPTVVRGYKLTSSTKAITPEQAAAKRAEVARILATTKL